MKELNLIKEPKGVDFVIQSSPLTEEERIEISEFIANKKTKKITMTKSSRKEKSSK